MPIRHTHESDEYLMNRVANGHADMLDPLVRRHASPLLTFISRMLGNRADGEEVFQEVFLAVWTKRSTYLKRYRFRPWLFQIARNACRARLRRSMVNRLVFTGPTLDDKADHSHKDPIESLISDEASGFVEQAVRNLPEKQRSVVVMRIWCGMPYAEIAECFGLRESTVRAHMHQALKALRHQLAPLILGPESVTKEPSND